MKCIKQINWIEIGGLYCTQIENRDVTVFSIQFCCTFKFPVSSCRQQNDATNNDYPSQKLKHFHPKNILALSQKVNKEMYSIQYLGKLTQ